ncbi:MAG TPA: response regulator [Bryobacteraceae bacterium]|nr:response regulator [Bryobacteraceae bacterium]
MPVDVLIVDDSAAIRKILQRVLAQANLGVGKVYEAADGREAMDAVKAQPVGLILSDINMPNMDGLQFLSELRSHDQWKHVPVLMISTEGSQTKVMEAVQLGAQGFVRKPFTADQIKEKLAGIL